MTIQIDGTNSINKGAELMLYAILQQIELHYPKASVILNGEFGKKKISSIASPIRLSQSFGSKYWVKRIKLFQILKKLHLPSAWASSYSAHKGVDLVFDASGFCISDQWNLPDIRSTLMVDYYGKLAKNNTKIFFLPQAWGPFEYKNTQKVLSSINNNATLIYARDKISFSYLSEARLNMSKIYKCPDFTCLINGIVPTRYLHLKDQVCIIPNVRMLDKTNLGRDEYINFIGQIINFCKEKGKKFFILNHSDSIDRQLCDQISTHFSIECVDYLNALEIKGVISQSFLVISSRYHGVASALNSYVPCVSTSWSHKYELLFNDFGQFNCVLNVKDSKESLSIISNYFDADFRTKRIMSMQQHKKNVIEETEIMWKQIWNMIKN